MTTEQRQSDVTSCGALIRIGGGASLVALLIHIVANAFLKEFPPADPTLAELQAYLEAEAGTWRIVHGMRYLAVVLCIGIFLAGGVPPEKGGAKTQGVPAR